MKRKRKGLTLGQVKSALDTAGLAAYISGSRSDPKPDSRIVIWREGSIINFCGMGLYDTRSESEAIAVAALVERYGPEMVWVNPATGYAYVNGGA